ncbi:unnamed protein product [Chrysoparadoxa australica]
MTAVNPFTKGEDSPDLAQLREMLMAQERREKQREKHLKENFDGYAVLELIESKWGLPYDLQLHPAIIAGKQLITLNVMWTHLGQSRFPHTEQEYMEHLQAIAELLVRWDRVDHFIECINDARKKPRQGTAVPIPMNLPPDEVNQKSCDNPRVVCTARHRTRENQPEPSQPHTENPQIFAIWNELV